nr:retrovirus-related Pol polyprotein from transposon TNT 1-94 [Tanacetum cinerariifolium]
MATSNKAAKKDDEIPVNNAPQKEQEEVNGDKEVPESMETEVPNVSTPVPPGSLSIPLVTSSIPRIISREGPSYPEPLSLGNAMTFENWLEDFFGDTSDAVSLNDVEVHLSNMETVIQPLGFQDLEFPHRVCKVEKAMYGLHQAPRAWYSTLSKYLLDNGFQRGLQLLQKKDGIFLSQNKYVGDILKKFGYTYIRSAKTPMDRENPWGKDGTGKDVELHLYRSMIGSLMYLTTSRPYIMFAVCVCARYQVTPKECHLHAVKRIFRYRNMCVYGSMYQQSLTRKCLLDEVDKITKKVSWFYAQDLLILSDLEFVLRLSIVAPTKNHEAFLIKILKGILQKNEPPLTSGDNLRLDMSIL